VLSKELPKTRSLSGPLIEVDTWQEILYFGDLVLQICTSHLGTPEAQEFRSKSSPLKSRGHAVGDLSLRDLALRGFVLLCISEHPKPGVPK
jgi:hypothetical protein